MSLRAILLASVLSAVGCHRHSEQTDVNQLRDAEERLSDVTSTQPGTPALSAKDAVPARSHCMDDNGAQTTVDDRLKRAVERCAAGLVSKSPAAEWTATPNSTTTIAGYALSAPTCVRAIIATRTPNRTTVAALVNGQGQQLAEAASDDLVVVPEDGPFCLANSTHIGLRVAAGPEPLAGLAVLLESP